MEESLKALITQRVAEVLAGGAPCVVNIQATIGALEVAGDGSPMVDVTLIARVDDRMTSRRIAVHSGDDDALGGRKSFHELKKRWGLKTKKAFYRKVSREAW